MSVASRALNLLWVFWSRHAKIVCAALLVIIALIAFNLRAQQYYNVVNLGITELYPEAKLDELDTFINYWIVSYMDKHGPLSLLNLTAKNPDTCLFWYPSCRNLYTTELPGHLMTIYVLYQLFKPLGVNLYDLMALLTPLLGALAVVFIALAVNEATGSKIGALAAAATYALSYISREVAGFTVKYSFGLFTAPLVLWLHLRLVKAPSLLRAVLSGLALAYAASVWTGVGLTALPIYLTLILVPLFVDLTRQGIVRSHLLTLAVEVAIPSIAMALMPPYHGGRAVLLWAFPISYAFLLLGFALHKLMGRNRALRVYFAMLVALIVAGATIVAAMAVIPGFMDAVTKVIPMAGKILLGLGVRPPGLARTVAQYQQLGTPLPFSATALLLLILFIIVPTTFYEVVKKRSLSLALLLVAWMALSWYAAFNVAYFLDYMKIATAVCVGLSAGLLLNYARPHIVHLGKMFRLKMGFTQIVAAVLAALIAVSIPCWNAQTEASYYQWSYTMIVRAENFYRPTTVWLEALRFLRSNTSRISLVISWWDYGYWISVVGERATVADGATIDGAKIQKLAHLFASPLHEALRHLQSFGTCSMNEVYLLIFAPIDYLIDREARTIYVAFPVLNSFGDATKFVSAMVYLATGREAVEGPYTTYTTYLSPYTWELISVPTSLEGNSWVVRKVLNIRGQYLIGGLGLNWASANASVATLPRLLAYATFEWLAKQYPGHTLIAVPWIIGTEVVGEAVAEVIDLVALKQFVERGIVLEAAKLGDWLPFEVIYVGASEPVGLARGLEAYRQVLVIIFKLRSEVQKALCSS